MIATMLSHDRQRRLQLLDALEARAKQFRSRDESWPFRMPHEPLDLHGIVADAIADAADAPPFRIVRTRGILRLEWASGGLWELRALTLPSRLHLYCDTDGDEARVLASARRGTAGEADGFFLERLAESRGHLFGIEMAGPPPDRVKSSIGDREFLADVFVELFEGSDAESALRQAHDVAGDFRAVVVTWLAAALSAPPMTRRQPRVREEDPSAP